mgnify:CR=1 FL=1
MNKVRVGIIGIGNCASSLVQGVHYYRDADAGERVPGVMNVDLGGYQIKDIEFVCAFDIDRRKVGKDISEAVFAKPNNTTIFAPNLPNTCCMIHKGNPLDGVGEYLKDVVEIADEETADVVSIIRETKVDVLVNYLPVGSENAAKWYAQKAIEAGVAFVNAITVFIASNAEWGEKFRKAGLPVLGDDIKSQVGATILHRVLTNLFLDRGMPIDHTYQLNVGGNTDFQNMLQRSRLESKKISKTGAVTSQIRNRGETIDDKDVHVGPSDHVPWLSDNKVCYLRIQGRHWGDVPMDVECRLSVEDSPNSAGVIADAVRLAKLAKDAGLAGPIIEPSSYLFKTPPVQYTDTEARDMTQKFIKDYGKK